VTKCCSTLPDASRRFRQPSLPVAAGLVSSGRVATDPCFAEAQPMRKSPASGNGEGLTSKRVSRPSALRYQILVDRLTDSHTKVMAGSDPLNEALRSLRSVIEFAKTDPVFRDDAPILPLIELHAALHDLQQGAKPELFKIRKNPTGATKPSDRHRDHLRAFLAGALDLLFLYGRMNLASASEWLARECRSQDVKDETGHWIAAKKLRRWRELAEEGGPRDWVSTYRLLQARNAKQARSGDLKSLGSTQTEAKKIIRVVAKNDSRLPPSNREGL